jgi:DNA recombination protein RmuC
MGQQFLGFIPALIGLLVGLILGIASAWLVLRARLEAARNAATAESKAEITRLQERISSSGEELERERAGLAEHKTTIGDCQKLLNAAREECAHLTERANRLSGLEGQVSALQDSLREETARAAALAEQCQRTSGLEQELQSSLIEKQKLHEEIAGLREQLGASSAKLSGQEQRIGRLETERAAALAEHCQRTSVLEQELQSSLIEKGKLHEEIAGLREQLGASSAKLSGQEQRIGRLETERSQLVGKRDELINENKDLQAELAKMTAVLTAEQEQGAEKLALLNGAKEQLRAAFTCLANDILETKAAQFTEQNNTNLGQILEPLKTQLNQFKSKVEQVYVQETEGRAALGQQVLQLTRLNQQLSQDAQNLANALKGSAKTQGNWGEMILVRVLEASGLSEGRDYQLRPSYQRENGHRGQPDVVINLPGEKHLVIDAKASLTDYERYVNAVEEGVRCDALGGHLNSMHRHVKELSEQDYQKLYGLNSLDFVIMFVPIESAFAVALAQDTTLWEEAWRKNVLLVSPSTLLFVLRTVAYLWQQEDQARHVREIADRGAELYNKLVGFIEDLDKLDDRLHGARDSFDSAYKKLSKGRGNVIRQAEMLKEMGVKPTKALPADLVESAMDDAELIPSLAAVDGSEQ